MAKEYSEKSIKSFQGLAGVRQRPAVYVGQMNSNAMFILAKELLDNTLDEFMAGRNTYCHAIIERDSVIVYDYGNGIPVGKVSVKEANGTTTSISALEAVVSRLHTGGKFDGDGGAYGSGSVGTHGIGIKATNALSKSFEVWTRREGTVWYTSYEKGVCVEPVSSKKVVAIPQLKDKKVGTIVRFTPDATLFEKGSKVDPSNILAWASLASKLSAGFKVDVTVNGKTTTFFNKSGVEDFLAELVEGHGATPLHENPLRIRTDSGIDIALLFTDYDGMGVQGYTNGVSNTQGGTHIDTLLSIVTKDLYRRGGAKQNFRGSDLQEGLVGIVNVRISSPAFTTQTKECLVDSRVPDMFAGVDAEVKKFFDKNKALVKQLCDRAHELRKLKEEFKATKDAARKLKTAGKSKAKLPAKLLASSSKCPPEKRVLYLVEGDSASGSCDSARDPFYQEVLPLRGKIINVFKLAKGKRIWDSDEVLNILQSIGYDPSLEDPLSSLRVGKIVLLGDGDVDGSHVNLLNLSLIAKVCPSLIETGRVYIGRGYEFVAQDDDGSFHCGDSVSELQKKVPARLRGRISHIKGWGELEWQALKFMVFDPKTARLTQVKMDKGGMHKLATLMGEDVLVRKELLGI